MLSARLAPLMSSARTGTGKDDWGTPADLFASLNQEFDFTLDPCASAENAKVPHYFTVEQDGLAQPWGGRVFVNPPYSVAEYWIAKARESARITAQVVVVLMPARCDTDYWHGNVWQAAEVRLIDGRLTFEGAKHPAPFPSAIIIFRQGVTGPPVFVPCDKLGVPLPVAAPPDRPLRERRQPELERAALSVRGLARRWRVAPKRIRQMIRRGVVAAICLGDKRGTLRILPESILAAEQRMTASPPRARRRREKVDPEIAALLG